MYEDIGMIKAIIFDCFGVLITDPLELLVQTRMPHNQAATDLILRYAAAAAKGQMDADTARIEITRALGISSTEYQELTHNQAVKNQLLMDYILSLRQTYKTGLLSNTSRRSLSAHFTDDELYDHFDTVATSADIGATKPSSEAYEITASRLGVQCHEAIMIDDRQDHCDGARAAGMPAILYRSLSQLPADLASRL